MTSGEVWGLEAFKALGEIRTESNKLAVRNAKLCTKKNQKPEEEGILLETFANFSVNWKVLHRELHTIIIGYSAKDVGDSINDFHKIKLNKLSCEKAQFFVAEKK